MPNYEQGIKGAAGGALVGGAVGGPIGAGIGGAAGGLLGMFGSSGYQPSRGNFNIPGFHSQYKNYGQLSNHYGSRVAPQMGESAFRGDQTSLVRMLQAQAAGRGPGQALVRMQAQQAANNAMRTQLGIAAGAAPGGSAQAARTAALAGGEAQSAVGGQAAMAGLQAQLGAIGQLGGVLQGARGQDLARGNANMQARLQQTGMNDQAQLEALRQRLAASQAQQSGGMAYEQLKAGLSAQPGIGDQLMGMGAGAGQAWLMRRAGQQGGGYTTGDHGSTAFNPYSYGFSV